MIHDVLYELREIKTLLSFQKQVLTLDEFCSYAGISKSYAYRLTSANKIKCYRPFGKLIYFDKDEVIDYLKQNSTNGVMEREKKMDKYLLNSKF